MNERVGSAAENDATSPDAWIHLDSLPPNVLQVYAQRQLKNVLARKPPGLDEETYRGRVGVVLSVWSTIGAFAENEASKGVLPSDSIAHLTDYARAVTAKREEEFPEVALPTTIASFTGRHELSRAIGGLGTDLSNTTPDALCQDLGITTGARSTDGQVRPEHQGQSEQANPSEQIFPGLTEATGLDLVDYLDATIRRFSTREGIDEAAKQHTGQVLGAIRNRANAGAGRGEPLEVVMADLRGFADRLQSDATFHRGPYAQPAFRDGFINYVGELESALHKVSSTGTFRAMIGRMQGAAFAAASSARQASPPARATGSETHKPQSESPEQESRAKFIQEAVRISTELEGTGIFTDVPGEGYNTIYSERSLQYTYAEEKRHNLAVAIWNKRGKYIVMQDEHGHTKTIGDLGAASPQHESDIMAEAVAFTPAYDLSWSTNKSGKKLVAYTPREFHGANGPEPVVRVSYNFCPVWKGISNSTKLEDLGIIYREATSGRPGGRFAYAVELPISMAKSIRDSIQTGDTSLLCELGDALVQKHASEPYKKMWNQEKMREAAGHEARKEREVYFDHHIYPPNTLLPVNVPLHVFDAMSQEAQAQQMVHEHTTVDQRSVWPEFVRAA